LNILIQEIMARSFPGDVQGKAWNRLA